MKISLPTTFENQFLIELDKLNQTLATEKLRIGAVYGAFQTSVVGSARPSKYLPKSNPELLRDHVQLAHELGLEFLYLMNASCLGNLEYSSRGRKEIFNLLDLIHDMGVDSLVVTIPYVMELIQQRYPDWPLVASSLCYISSVHEALKFQRLGVKRLILDPDINRNFPLLRDIRRKVKAELEIIVNHSCLLHCPYEYSHYNNTGHGSQRFEGEKEKIYNQYNLLKCTLEKLKNPSEFLRSPWIPPSEVDYLEDIGIHWLKIAGRGSSKEELLAIAQAYLEKNYQGNLITLLGWPHWLIYRKSPSGETLAPLEIYLSTRKLENFLDLFKRDLFPCQSGCLHCNYCEEWARKALIFDQGLLERYVENMEGKLQSILRDDLSEEEYQRQIQRWEAQADACTLSSD